MLSGTQLGALAIGGALAAAMSPRAIFVTAGILGLLAPVAFARKLLRSVTRPRAEERVDLAEDVVAAVSRAA